MANLANTSNSSTISKCEESSLIQENQSCIFCEIASHGLNNVAPKPAIFANKAEKTVFNSLELCHKKRVLNTNFAEGETIVFVNLNAKSAKHDPYSPQNRLKSKRVNLYQTLQVEGYGKLYAAPFNTISKKPPISPTGRRKRKAISKKLKTKVGRSVKYMYRQFGYVNMITLNQKFSLSVNGYQFRAMLDLFFNRLRKYVKRKLNVDDIYYVWKIEPQPTNGSLHVHICLPHFIEKEWLNRNWNECQLQTYCSSFLTVEKANRYYAKMLEHNSKCAVEEKETWRTLRAEELERYKCEIEWNAQEMRTEDVGGYSFISFPHIGNMNKNKSGSYVYKTVTGEKLHSVKDVGTYIAKDIYVKGENSEKVHFEYIKGNIIGFTNSLNKALKVDKMNLGVFVASEVNTLVEDVKQSLNETTEHYFEWENTHTETKSIWVADGIYLNDLINEHISIGMPEPTNEDFVNYENEVLENRSQAINKNYNEF